MGKHPGTRWAPRLFLAVTVFYKAPCVSFLVSFVLKMGPDVCSKWAAILAPHLALSGGWNVSPLVISETDSPKPTLHQHKQCVLVAELLRSQTSRSFCLTRRKLSFYIHCHLNFTTIEKHLFFYLTSQYCALWHYSAKIRRQNIQLKQLRTVWPPQVSTFHGGKRWGTLESRGQLTLSILDICLSQSAEVEQYPLHKPQKLLRSMHSLTMAPLTLMRVTDKCLMLEVGGSSDISDTKPFIWRQQNRGSSMGEFSLGAHQQPRSCRSTYKQFE